MKATGTASERRRRKKNGKGGGRKERGVAYGFDCRRKKRTRPFKRVDVWAENKKKGQGKKKVGTRNCGLRFSYSEGIDREHGEGGKKKAEKRRGENTSGAGGDWSGQTGSDYRDKKAQVLAWAQLLRLPGANGKH